MAMSPVFEVGVLAFPDADAAGRVADGLRESNITDLVNDISILQHQPDGRFSVHAWSQETTRGAHMATGAVIGAIAGTLLLGPFGPLLGLLGGGAVGASMGGRDPHDLGLSEDFVTELRASLPPGSSAVLVVGEPGEVGELMGRIRATDAVISKELHQPLTNEQAKAIRDAIEQEQQKKD